MQHETEEFKARITKLQSLLSKHVPADLIAVASLGYLSALWRVCWAQCTDVPGTVAEVEQAIGWNGEPGALVKAMASAEFVVEARGCVMVRDAVTECPEYARRRWQRHSMAGYSLARSRSAPPTVSKPNPAKKDLSPEDAAAIAADPINAFDPALRLEQGKYWSVPGVPICVRHYALAWKRRYGGADYPWQTKDLKIISDMLDATGSTDRLASAMTNYLKSEDPFHKGHPLSKLSGSLTTFDHQTEEAVRLDHHNRIDKASAERAIANWHAIQETNNLKRVRKAVDNAYEDVENRKGSAAAKAFLECLSGESKDILIIGAACRLATMHWKKLGDSDNGHANTGGCNEGTGGGVEDARGEVGAEQAQHLDGESTTGNDDGGISSEQSFV